MVNIHVYGVPDTLTTDVDPTIKRKKLKRF